MPDTESSRVEILDQEALAYRRLLTDELRIHKRSLQLSVLTGLGFLAVGIVIASYFSTLAALGWLLAIVGILRALNGLYELQREDQLKRRLKRLGERFGRPETP